MPSNWYLFFATALIPLAIGFFWYGAMGFGKKWMRINGFTEESLAGANMGVINFRDFGHGALHGGALAIMLVFPLIAINSLFERRGWVYIGIHTGYWFVVFTLIGGVLCQFLTYGPAS